MRKQNGGPAFPCDQKNRPYPENYTGMSLRDYFAAKAMQGMISNPKAKSNIKYIEMAYKIADAMIEEREK